MGIMLKKPRILVVGSFVMDLIASTHRIPKPGETVVGDSFHTAPGGKGANQAVQCARLGAEVTMAGCVGGDVFGRLMLDTAREAGVDVSHVSVNETVSSGIGHVLLEVRGQAAQNRITLIPGANFAMTVEQVAWLEQEIGSFDLVMLQLEIPMEVNAAVARWARTAGVPVMLNPAPARELPPELLECVTYLSPNETEAAALSGLPLEAGEAGVDDGQLRRVAAALRARGVEHVIITLGCNGSAAADRDGVRYVPRVSMERVADPTAAGDSYVAAFCTGLTAGLPEKEAMAFASHAAALTVSRMGAMPSLPGMEEVQALLRQRGYRGFEPGALDALKRREG